MSEQCEVTLETWIRFTPGWKAATLRDLVSQKASSLLGTVTDLWIDVHAAETHSGYAHACVRARQDHGGQLANWSRLHESLEDELGFQVAVSKLTVWIPDGLPGRDMAQQAAERVMVDMGLEPRVWSQYDGEVKVSHQPIRVPSRGASS